MSYVVLFLILIGFLVIPFVILHERQTRENWRQAAEQLGLRFQGKGLLESKKIEGTLGNSFVTLDTYRRSRGKNSTVYTRLRLHYPQPLGIGLKLTRQGFFNHLIILLGAQDIEVGDEGFDRLAVIKGTDERRVREFLTPARRVRIERLLRNYPEIVIGDDSISLDRHGVIRNTQVLVGLLQSASRVAWHLTADRDEDAAMSAAMEAQDSGRPDEALRMLRELQERRSSITPVGDDQIIDAELVEEHLLAGEILEMAGRHGEAASVFDRVRQHSPADTELELWTEHASELARSQTPASIAESPRSESARSESARSESARSESARSESARSESARSESARSESARSESIDANYPVDAAEFCRKVFDTSHSSFAAAQFFEQHYAGRQVVWSGPLRRVERMSYDMVFGDEEACRATVEIHGSPSESYFSAIKAFLKLPPEFAESLRSQVGSEISFRGRLLKLDAFMKNVYVTEGELLS
jgi:hypothetical protein